MKLHYKYIYIILSILLLLSLLAIIHIQKEPIIIDTNTNESFENNNQDNNKANNEDNNKDKNQNKNKDNLEIQPSPDTINKKGSNLVIDFTNPPGQHSSMQSLFMKWTNVKPGHFKIIRYHENNIYGVDNDGHVWKGDLKSDRIEKFIKDGQVKNIQISNNFIYGIGNSGKIYKRNLDGSGKWEQISKEITNHVFTIYNSVIYTISEGRLATLGVNADNMHLGAKADAKDLFVLNNKIYMISNSGLFYERNLNAAIRDEWKAIPSDPLLNLYGYEKYIYVTSKNNKDILKINTNGGKLEKTILKTPLTGNFFIVNNYIYGITQEGIFKHPLTLAAIEGFSGGNRGPNTIIPDLLSD